ncbi:MAG: head protein [Rhizobium sp.]|nr:MAG: head protein [Rhizobium sp.]
MTKVTGAMATYDVTTNREDLADAVYRISPVDTPFMTAVPRTKATAVLHEWSTHSLSSINTTNARLEGDALTRAAATAPARAQNYCQISSRDATVTGTQRATNPAGIDDMMAFQMAAKSLELRRDMEAILLGNTGQNAGNTTTARTLRSFNAWINGNGSRSSATTGGGADSTGATYAATDATAGFRAFDETLLKDALLDAFNDGGEPMLILTGPFNKQKFSTFTGRSTSQLIVKQDQIDGAAELYRSDFGVVKVVPNRSQRERDIYVVDTSKVAVSFLRAFEPQELGRVGDAITRDIISEYTLEMRNRDAHAGIFDVTTT